MIRDTECSSRNEPSRNIKAVAMMGGTFDPIHIGHLRSAIELREMLSLDNVHLVVNRVPPHRQVPGVTPEDRLAMVQAAVASLDGIIVDDQEIRRSGPSYSVLTLASLRREYGPEARLVMAVGIDAFVHLAEWYEAERIFELAHVVVIERPGADLTWTPELVSLIAHREVEDITTLMQQPHGSLAFVSLPCPVEISATELRKRINRQLSIRFLVPAGVEEIISERHLYRE